MLSNRQLFLLHNAQTTEMPLMLEIERAEGVYLYGTKGEKYLDLISGIGVNNIGHCHPKVVEAIQTQAAKFLHTMVYGEYVQAPQTLFATELCKYLPSNLQSIYLLNSGAEAIEGAMKLAKRVTGRFKTMACVNSYHGSSHGALSIMGNEEYKQAYRPLVPGIEFIRFGVMEDIGKISAEHAAFFIETVQGESGIQTASKEYWQALSAHCKSVGCLLVLDEIQAGFGRTGKMFAFENYDIVPDILVIAKGMGGGMPIGAFISSKENMHTLTNNPILGHITTFGGHPVSCAAALASLSVLHEEKLIDDVAKKAELFRSLLVHPKIKEIRGLGLMLSIQLESFEYNKKVIDRCIANGVIVDWFLHCSDAMRIAAPLVISEEEIKFACRVILEAL
jgi:acetylornithine/succinyldiaminopimelate/putrescine aminotransferase